MSLRFYFAEPMNQVRVSLWKFFTGNRATVIKSLNRCRRCWQFGKRWANSSKAGWAGRRWSFHSSKRLVEHDPTRRPERAAGNQCGIQGPGSSNAQADSLGDAFPGRCDDGWRNCREVFLPLAHRESPHESSGARPSGACRQERQGTSVSAGAKQSEHCEILVYILRSLK